MVVALCSAALGTIKRLRATATDSLAYCLTAAWWMICVDDSCSDPFQLVVPGRGDLTWFTQPYVVDRTFIVAENAVALLLLCHGHQGHQFPAPPKAPKSPSVSHPLSSFRVPLSVSLEVTALPRCLP